MPKHTTITVVDYPSSFNFITDKPLPEFYYGCEVRTKLLHEAMESQQIESPCHAYDDYIVEAIDIKPNGSEDWQIGS